SCKGWCIAPSSLKLDPVRRGVSRFNPQPNAAAIDISFAVKDDCPCKSVNEQTGQTPAVAAIQREALTSLGAGRKMPRPPGKRSAACTPAWRRQAQPGVRRVDLEENQPVCRESVPRK